MIWEKLEGYLGVGNLSPTVLSAAFVFEVASTEGFWEIPRW
jgi:hypothetical protein